MAEAEQPVGCDKSQTGEGVAQGRADALQAIQGAHRGKHVSRVTPLAPASAKQALLTTLGEQAVEEQMLGVASDHACAKRTEHR